MKKKLFYLWLLILFFIVINIIFYLLKFIMSYYSETVFNLQKPHHQGNTQKCTNHL